MMFKLGSFIKISHFPCHFLTHIHTILLCNLNHSSSKAPTEVLWLCCNVCFSIHFAIACVSNKIFFRIAMLVTEMEFVY